MDGVIRNKTLYVGIVLRAKLFWVKRSHNNLCILWRQQGDTVRISCISTLVKKREEESERGWGTGRRREELGMTNVSQDSSHLSCSSINYSCVISQSEGVPDVITFCLSVVDQIFLQIRSSYPIVTQLYLTLFNFAVGNFRFFSA